MKIAVTGGSGFIGSRLVQRLRDDGHEVAVIDLNHADQPIDVTDEAAMMGALKGVDVIYNLAAQHRDDVRPLSLYYDVNVGGAEVLIKAADAYDIKTIIFTSTVAVYGLNAGQSKETDQPDPFNDYGRSKLQAEEVLNAWADERSDRSLVTMRLVASFGPGNRGNVYTLMNQISRDRFVMVGDGRNSKSLAYVENVAAFLVHCLSFGQGRHLYNYADKPDMNMADMIANIRTNFGRSRKGIRLPYWLGICGGFVFDMLAKLTGKRFPISVVRVQKFCADTVVNADKVHQSGFEAPYDLYAGLERMIAEDFLPEQLPKSDAKRQEAKRKAA